jgi:hypothetical protein
MAFGDLVVLASLVSLGGVLLVFAFAHLIRVDRLHMSYRRQAACRWHRWQAVDGGTSLTCTVCGKKSRRINPDHVPDLETTYSGINLP